MYEKGFKYLLTGGNEAIIYGALKQLHIDQRTENFEDLVEEGKLAFVVAYDDYRKKIAEEQDLKGMNAYIYQRVRWKIIDVLRKEWNYQHHFEIDSNEELLAKVIDAETECLIDKFGNTEILSKLWDCCTENERKYLKMYLVYDLSVTEIAKNLKISRKTVYNYKSKIRIKYKRLKK